VISILSVAEVVVGEICAGDRVGMDSLEERKDTAMLTLIL
jgi:hypothetical protein